MLFLALHIILECEYSFIREFTINSIHTPNVIN